MSEKSKLDLSIMGKLLRFSFPYSFVFISAIILMILFAFLGPIRPVIIMEMINNYVAGDGQVLSDRGIEIQTIINWFTTQNTIAGQLYAWTVFLLVLLVIETLIQFLLTYFANLLGQSIIRDIRIKLYKHFNSFKLKYFDTTPNGTVVTRMVSDIEAIADVFTTGLITMIGDIIRLVFVIYLMFEASWKLSLLALIPIPLLLIATRIFARAMKKAFQHERLQVNKLNTFVQEHISGMFIVQLFNRQKIESEKFDGINQGHRNAHVSAVWANSIFFPVVELLSSLSIAFLIMWAMFQVDQPPSVIRDSFGMVVGFTLWIHMLYRPIRQLADRFNVLQRGMVRAERVLEILERKEHIDDKGTIQTFDFNQKITFDNVWFAYKDTDWVLKGISFEVGATKSVALVGTTGAGKSTITNLLTRFYEFQKGSIKIGETNIREIELQTLRQNIAIVLQEVFLFSDSILFNITLGDESISKEKVIEAAKKVGAHEFIMRLPGGYDYNVRERGGVLSVGQKQLISFIRAYVYNPKILILDEATASVDSESEELIQKATQELQKGRTSIVIAHRLSTIINSSEILVIDQGQIKERGNHEELIKMDGHYKKLYELNFSQEESKN
ncbi:ABC transporter ATP-binding protein [Crocinitomix algicola]|uniref:ABC transporter ATP-binding protein n=1 Tax=Crocinitomix algicola TaxID=1740263 RepID=UPI0008728899|nr:ABC transporter ATP-binding protein [Crocinitomix algicola]